MSSIFPDHHEKYLNDATRCKTRQCTKYQYKVQQVDFNFFDTPGINDTGGYLSDNENLEKIFQCIQSVDHLTALVLILNGTQARLTINIKNILERLHDRLPDIFYSNIILILTNCSAHTNNLDSVKLINHPPIFHMQNSAFSSDPQTWSEQTYQMLQRDWNISMQTMNEFIKSLVLSTPISTKSLTDINNNRNSIRSILHETRLMIMELQHIEAELTALEQASHIYSTNISKISKLDVNKYTEAEKDKAACEIKYKTVQETKYLIEQLLQEQLNKVRVQNNCQRFNVDEELCTFVKLLKNDMMSLRSTAVIHKATQFIENLEMLANDNSRIVCKSPRSKRKTRTSKRRDQPQTISDELVIINPTSESQVDRIPLEDGLLNGQKYAEYTTEQLLDLTRQSIEKHTLISTELNRRCEGTSMGYLSPTQLLTLCEYYTSSRLLRSDELNCLHEQLQLEIQQSTDSDPLEILAVPVDKLLQLTAIKLCLQNADKYQ
jgi:hypothetical protein